MPGSSLGSARKGSCASLPYSAGSCPCWLGLPPHLARALLEVAHSASSRCCCTGRPRAPPTGTVARLAYRPLPVSIVSGAWSGWERLLDAPPRAGRAVLPCQPTVLCVPSGEDPAHFPPIFQFVSGTSILFSISGC